MTWCSTDNVPGTNSVLGERCSKHASAIYIGMVPNQDAAAVSWKSGRQPRRRQNWQGWISRRGDCLRQHIL
jgi:hypothetical protein